MTRLLFVLLAATLLPIGAASAASADDAVPEKLKLRMTGIPALVEPATPCNDGTVVISGASVPEGVPAQAALCLLNTRDLCQGRTQIDSHATVQLEGIPGALLAVVRITEFLKSPSVATRIITGEVIGGTGDFEGLLGAVHGGGTITFDPFGPPVADLTLNFDLHEERTCPAD